jgi:DNA integrity scanning protein DisA with diadenylate cyclase activity
VLTVGRSQSGIRYDGLKEDERIHLIILLIAGENARDYLRVLAAVARLIKDKEFVEGLISAPSLEEVNRRLYAGFGGILEKSAPLQQNRVNRTILRHAEKIARGTQCHAIMVFGDTTSSIGQVIQWSRSAKKTILVTRNLSESGAAEEEFSEVIQVKSYSNQRLAQLRSAVLVALSRGTLQVTDRVCCVGGIAESNQFDTVVVVEIEREFQPLLAGQADLLPADVKPEVLERVLAVATELSVEGREGRPVGCLFVVVVTGRVDLMV